MTFTISQAALLQPERLTQHSAWIGHIPFAAWLIAELRPRIFVELGTHAGDSYLAFCQAMREHGVAAKSYAVDTWQGDEHAGFYANEIYEALHKYHQPRFGEFSQLLRMTFDEALGYFGDDSVDLLHIDGLHTYDAVRHDFESWLPKMTTRGVVLFHDVNVRERDFGVWQLWAELAARYPAFEFTHAHGLGVLFVGQDYAGPQKPALLDRIEQGAPVFARLGQGLVVSRQLATKEEEFEALAQRLGPAEQAMGERDRIAGERDALRAHIEKLNIHAENLERHVATLDPHIERLTALVATQSAEIAGESSLRRQAENDVASLGAELKDLQQYFQGERDEYGRMIWSLQHEIGVLRASKSWRLTGPFRRAVRALQTMRRRAGILVALERHARSVGYLKTGGHVLTAFRQGGLKGIRTGVSRAHGRVAGLAHQKAKDVADPVRPREVRRHGRPVDIVVCVHNALDDVARCLESVTRHTFPPYRLIVVDDGSQVPTRDYLARFVEGQPAVLIRHEEAKGYTLAANAGMRAATADYVVLLNSDTIVSPYWLDRLVECADSDPGIGAVGPLSNTASWQSVPRIFDEAGDWAENRLPPDWDVARFAEQVAHVSPRIYPQVGFLNGFCFLITRRLLDAIGPFDDVTFARGYGEENDYCLRAVEAGWRLAIADDCYVYHAQSKSYSHERRQALVEQANKALEAKHPRGRIDTQLRATREHLALEAVRRRTGMIATRAGWLEQIGARHAGRRVLFLLPVASAGGGANVVITEARALRTLGVDAVLVNIEPHRASFEASYPGLDVPVTYIHDHDALASIIDGVDAVVATIFKTVDWIEPLAGQAVAFGYYIQDYEPDFFPAGSPENLQARRSYTAMPSLKMFTKTRWNQQALLQRQGVAVQCIGPSFDWTLFHPGAAFADGATAVRVVAMVRPSTPRRAPEMTMRVLRQLKRKFGPGIAITVFGTTADDPGLLALPHDFDFDCVGELTVNDVASLLRRADVFLDLSLFQAMGLTAMEAMATGVAVVGPTGSGLDEIIVDGENGLLVDTRDEDACVAAAQRLIADSALRNRLRTNALDVVRFHPEASAARMLDILFPQTS